MRVSKSIMYVPQYDRNHDQVKTEGKRLLSPYFPFVTVIGVLDDVRHFGSRRRQISGKGGAGKR